MQKIRYLTTTALFAAGLLVAGPALAAGDDAKTTAPQTNAPAATPAPTNDTMQPGAPDATVSGKSDADARTEAQQLVAEATKVVEQMKQDPELDKLLQQAQGIYIVPNFGKGALVAGGRGGDGVMLAKQDGSWGNPVFFDFGAVSVGAQAGVSAGAVAMVLMNDEAVNSFKEDNNWSINADADLTVVDYSAMAQASAGKGDIVMWSDVEGAFAGGAVSVTDISLDEEATQAYYGQPAKAQGLIEGTTKVGPQQAKALRDALSG